MRIGVVTHYWLPHRGGVEVMAYEQARRLSDRGHDVHVVTSAIGADAGIELWPAAHGRVVVERRPATDVLGVRGVPWPIPSPQLVRAWSQLAARCDVLLVHGSTYAHSPVAVAEARRRGTPVLLLQSNPHVDYPGIVDRVESAVDHTLGRWCCRRADQVASISQHTARHVARISPRSRHESIVYIGVDHHRFRPPTAAERAAHRAHLAFDNTTVLTVRRLVERNGVEWAMRTWIDHGLDAHGTFVVVGDGPQRRDLERLARGHQILLLGAVGDETLEQVFGAADIFTMPTRSGEGFGLAAAEAMACGLPVVASDGGALREVIADGTTGRVLPVDDAGGYAEALQQLMQDGELRSAMGRAGRERIETHFTWDRSVDQLEALLLRLAATREPVGSLLSPDHGSAQKRRMSA